MQFFSVWSDGNRKNPFAYALRQIDSLDAVTKRNPDKIVEVANSKEIYKAVKQHKLAAMFGVEGGHQIEDDLSKLDSLYKRGARYMTLTWNNSTSWASSAYDETFTKDLSHKGLTDFGKQVVHRMNELGMMVDISHVGETTFWDVIKTSTKPIIASHSSVYNLCHHQRNLKDDQIKAIAKNGGVIQINFNSGFLDSTEASKEEIFVQKYKAESDSLKEAGNNEDEIQDYIFWNHKKEAEFLRPPFSLLMQHIEYVIKLVGVDYVGIGSDYDGVESVPLEMDDVTKYPLITKALVEKGYSEKDIDKILGGNLLRVLKANEKH
ncbi:MAG: dipeptidase [Ginsengibacter sp.]